MSAVLSGLLGGLTAAFMVWLSQRTLRQSEPSTDGWNVLKPNWFAKSVVVLSSALSVLFGTLLLSALSSGETVEWSLIILFGFFCLGAIYVAWTGFSRKISWSSESIRIRSIFGHDISYRLSEVAELTALDSRGEYRFRFADGRRFWFPRHMHGMPELVDAISGTNKPEVA